jgi:hypothetical protein
MRLVLPIGPLDSERDRDVGFGGEASGLFAHSLIPKRTSAARSASINNKSMGLPQSDISTLDSQS